jgi:hypothetical protein
MEEAHPGWRVAAPGMLRLSWVGLSGLAQPRLTKGGQPYP